MAKKSSLTFVEMIRALDDFWRRQGCLLVIPWDQPKGAATFSPYTFFWSIDPKSEYASAYVEPCRRPADARYGDSPNRMGRYYQYQVFIKPAPKNIREIYSRSLETIGFKMDEHELRYLEDDWESPTLGATGVGWEVWLDGLEITQFTYFQSFAGVELKTVPVEITYGLERVAMYVQGVDNVYDLDFDHGVKYGEVFHKRFEQEFSRYQFEEFDAPRGFEHFQKTFDSAKELAAKGLILPAYERVMECSATFNNLDARGALSVAERNRLIARTREAAKAVAAAYLEQAAPKEAGV